MDVGRVFVRRVFDRWGMGMDDRPRIGLVNNVKNKTSQCNFIFSSGYLAPSLERVWLIEVYDCVGIDCCGGSEITLECR